LTQQVPQKTDRTIIASGAARLSRVHILKSLDGEIRIRASRR